MCETKDCPCHREECRLSRIESKIDYLISTLTGINKLKPVIDTMRADTAALQDAISATAQS